MAKMYRQGDVLIVEVDYDSTFSGSQELLSNNEPNLILARGEVSGHAHRIEGRSTARGWRNHETNELRVSSLILPVATRLVHEEHAPVEIPAGKYQVVRQREYRAALPNEHIDSRTAVD